jgi:hypothetical protein
VKKVFKGSGTSERPSRGPQKASQRAAFFPGCSYFGIAELLRWNVTENTIQFIDRWCNSVPGPPPRVMRDRGD